jgi:hypothetical protein
MFVSNVCELRIYACESKNYGGGMQKSTTYAMAYKQL